MTKRTLEIGLSSNYVPKWGLWEGIREIIQNAKDREDLTGEKLNINYLFDRKLLIITNPKTILSNDIWTFGYSEKKNFTDKYVSVRGKWGEGLKLACLALMRANKRVAVLNKNKIFRPKIENSSLSGHPTLQIEVEHTEKYCSDFYFAVKDITFNEWECLQKRFCFLDQKPTLPAKNNNEVLVDNKEQGNIYVDGIFVEHDPEILYGYNLSGNYVSLSRDRDSINEYSKAQIIPKTLIDALCGDGYALTRRQLFLNIFECNLKDSPYKKYKDICGFYSYNTLSVLAPLFIEQKEEKREEVKQMILELTKNKIICKQDREVADLERFGKEGRLLGHELYSVARELNCENTYDSFSARKLTNKNLKLIDLNELTNKQKNNFDRAIKIVKKGIKSVISKKKVYIADFKGELRGVYKEGNVYIDTQTLDNIGRAVVTLVHETAHQEGLDLTSGHVMAMEKVYRNIFNLLLEQKDNNNNL